MRKEVLMCDPTQYFRDGIIDYKINPHMSVGNTVNGERARQQHETVQGIFKELGVSILKIQQAPGLSDMVFAANYGFPTDHRFIKANFKPPQRQREADISREFFKELNFRILELPPEIHFEGQGDLLTIGGRYFFGHGFRSDHQAKGWLEKYVESDIADLRLINPYYYHLDTCFAPLNEDTVVINPGAFEEEGLRKIHEQFSHVVETSEEDNKVLACNLVVVGKTVVIGKGITQELKDMLGKLRFSIIETPMGEFRKSGGSVKCLTLEHY